MQHTSIAPVGIVARWPTPNYGPLSPPPARPQPLPNSSTDDDLVIRLQRAVELNARHAQLLSELPAEQDSTTEIDAIEGEICEITMEARRTPARTMKGVMAKARLMAALFADVGEIEENPERPQHPLDPEMIGYSICRDLFALCET
jgi:hypothetical protein